MTTRIETPEAEARRLRDAIYGPQRDPNNWDACKAAWIRDLPWLRKHAPLTTDH